jgi:membrane protease YdiL (CAAX protease family)
LNKKIIVQYLLITFVIAIFAWGICIILGQLGITLNNNHWLYILFAIGGFSPTIASYIVLKKNHYIKSFREWIKSIFIFKSAFRFYILVIIFIALYFTSRIIVNGINETNPLYLFFVLIPLMLFGGGMEEVGWRYILQPELDKKYGFIISAIIVAIIWSLWHLPLFFIKDASQYETNFLLFAIDILGLTFALGAIHKISNNVFLCILFHCILNAGSVTFNIRDTILGNSITASVLIIVSIITILFNKYRDNKIVI